MTEDPGTEKNKQDTQFRPGSIGQPSIKPNTIPKQTDPKPYEQHTQEGTNPAKPIFVQVIGGDDLKPFEKETLAISRKTYLVAVSAFVAALAAAIFVGSQVSMMSYQTQIMASQSEGANAGALMDQMNTRKQLAIAQEQAKAAQDSANALKNQVQMTRRNFVIDERPIVIAATIQPYVGVGMQIMADIYFGNYGKSPALKARGRGRIFFGKNAMHDAYEWFEGEARKPLTRSIVGTGVIMPPGAPSASEVENHTAHFSTLFSDTVLTKEEFDFVMANDFSAVVVLREEYYDQWGNRYWTDACWSHFANGAIPQCLEHNEVH
jgi:hypothetical protein